jgi:hypothetical protein
MTSILSVWFVKESDTVDMDLIESDIETPEVVSDNEREDLKQAGDSGIAHIRASEPDPRSARQRLVLRYVLLPFVFLTVALLGGLRISGVDSSFIFLKPALLCLILAVIMLTLFFRSGLIRLDGWFAEDLPMTKNVANAAILLTLFAATTQLLNSLMPEQGLPFWIVAFCFFWTLWNNLFADFDTKKLLRSLGALFGLAFVTKYLLLANLTAPAGKTWFEALTENPAQEAVTRLLDLPRFAAATGYIQFFTAAIYLFGLFILPQSTRNSSILTTSHAKPNVARHNRIDRSGMVRVRRWERRVSIQELRRTRVDSAGSEHGSWKHLTSSEGPGGGGKFKL